MTAKHTPGPWRVVVESKDTRRGARGSVRKWVSVMDPNQYLAKLPLSRMADARLIAAAPELLEALRGLSAANLLVCINDPLNPCWDGRPSDAPGRHWGGGDACLVCRARAAIAKATGEAP